MKKAICLISAALLMLTLASCGNKASDSDASPDTVIGGEVEVVNPNKDSSAEEAAAGLGLKSVTMPEGCTVDSAVEIDGTPVIYSFDVTYDSAEYTVRIAKADDGDADISGIYFSGETSTGLFNRAEGSDEPTVSVESDTEYIVAKCNWNGYLLSISAELGTNTAEDFDTLTVAFAQALIAQDNIA